MRLDRLGTGVITLSTGQSVKSTGSWLPLGAAYSKFVMRCCRATSVGTSNFSVKLYGAPSSVNTTGAAVGAIGAYTKPLLISYTQANVGTVKISTAGNVVSWVKWSSTTMTTAAGRQLRIEIAAVP